MYINNPQDLNPDTVIITTRTMAEYFMENLFLFLGRENDKYYFSKIQKFNKQLSQPPCG